MAKSEKKLENQLRTLGRQMKKETAKLKADYGRLYETVSEILFRNDPMGIKLWQQHR